MLSQYAEKIARLQARVDRAKRDYESAIRCGAISLEVAACRQFLDSAERELRDAWRER